MKKLYALLFVSLFSYCLQAQSWAKEWNLGYAYTSPTSGMKQHIRNGNGMVLDFHLLAPARKYSVGVELNYTVYGHDKSTQQYDFPDGTTAAMNVVVNNAFTNLVAVGRYYPQTTGLALPYFQGKMGYSWYQTDLNIYDPDDTDSCEPVESDLLQKDGTFIASVGGGIRLDFSSLFRKIPRQAFFLDLGANYTRGNKVNYMNTDAPDTRSMQSQNSRSGDVQAGFINTQTKIIHKHHVGYLYSNTAEMIDFRASLVFRPGGLCF